MDLRTKLVFALVSACLLSMGALGSFTYLWAEDMFLGESQRQLDALVERKRAELRSIVEDWKEEVQDLAGRTLRTHLAAHLEGRDATSQGSLTRLVGDAQARGVALRRITLVDARGNPLFGSDPLEPEAASAVSEGEVGFSGIRVEPDQSLSMVFHSWIVLDGRRSGLLQAVFRADSLDEIVGPAASIGETAETILVAPSRSEDRYFVVTSRKDRAGLEATRRPLSEAPPHTSSALGGEEQVFAATIDRRGQEVMATTRFLPELGLGIVVQVESAEIRQRADRLLVNMGDLGAALAAIAILGGTLLGFHLARPLHELVEDVDRIRHGEFGLQLRVKGEDEVAFLARSLNEFMDQLNRSSDLFQLGELNVLVVDGDAEHGRVLHDLLRNWNLRPTLAERGATASDAIEQAKREGGPFQLIVLDESLPDTNGIQWAEDLCSSARQPCPIILLSSSAEALAAAELQKAGIGRILPKPLVASHLMEAILEEMGVSAEGLADTADVLLKKTSPRKILLVEDSRLIQKVMTDFLENWGHRVTLAENGRLAVERTRTEAFDLILMDVEMPEMNGLEAAAAIRANEGAGERRTPIIALTAEARSEDRERCLAAGMDDYLAKPADPKALYALIHRIPPRT